MIVFCWCGGDQVELFSLECATAGWLMPCSAASLTRESECRLLAEEVGIKTSIVFGDTGRGRLW